VLFKDLGQHPLSRISLRDQESQNPSQSLSLRSISGCYLWTRIGLGTAQLGIATGNEIGATIVVSATEVCEVCLG
jgi:hypothetical protein